MGDLRCSVRLHGTLVEDRVLRVRSAVRIGESTAARVSFPGADIAVVRIGRDLALRGRRLAEGEGIGVSLGPVRVWLEHTARARVPAAWRGQFDLRFLATALLVTVAGLWLETIDSALEARSSRGFVTRELVRLQARGLLPGQGSPGWGLASDRRTAGVSAHGDAPGTEANRNPMREGPEALSDDHRSGMAYHAWYRHAVPDDSALTALARERLARNPVDAGAHELLAHAAYEGDRFDQAVRHFHWLIENEQELRVGGSADLVWRLARAERRLGRHVVEAGLYQRLLEQDPDNARVLGAQATVMARLGRYDEARERIERATALDPADAYLGLFEAVVAAEQGLDEAALTHLELVASRRESLSPEYQVELRRDIALDPAFAPLRSDDRMRAMLVRQLGAAAPRPQR